MSRPVSEIPDEVRRQIVEYITANMQKAAADAEKKSGPTAAAATHKLVLKGFLVDEATKTQVRKAQRANRAFLKAEQTAAATLPPAAAAEPSTVCDEPKSDCGETAQSSS